MPAQGQGHEGGRAGGRRAKARVQGRMEAWARRGGGCTREGVEAGHAKGAWKRGAT